MSTGLKSGGSSTQRGAKKTKRGRLGALFYVLAINTDLVSLYSREASKPRMPLFIFTKRTHFSLRGLPCGPRYVNVYGQGRRKVALSTSGVLGPVLSRAFCRLASAFLGARHGHDFP